MKMEENEWVPQIQEQYLLGINHVLDYIQTEAYRMLVLQKQNTSLSLIRLKLQIKSVN